ncbi:MAG: aminoglycoside phosphotransferase family protein [candidate division KSB1 bacterium]
MFADHKTETGSLPALNPAWLKQYLPAYLWRENETPEEILAIQVLQVWWDEKRTTVLYQFRLREEAGLARDHLYVGYLVASERLREEYQSALKRAKHQPPAGRAVTIVPEANLILLAFPNDRKLRLFAQEEFDPWLKAKWRQHRALLPQQARIKKWKLKGASYEVLRYVPDKRFTMRCHVSLQHKDGATKELSVIAKQVSDGKKAKKLFFSLLGLQAAWANLKKLTPKRLLELRKMPMPVRFPRPLGWDDERALVFLEELPGKNLEHMLAEVELAPMLYKVGAMLATFHQAPKRVRKRVTHKSELKEVRLARREIVAVFPAWRARLRELLLALKTLPGQEEAREVLLHGTFRLNHVFVHKGEPALLDLDSLRMGLPAYDIANFLSALYYFEAQGRLTVEQRVTITSAFLQGYAAQSEVAVTPASVLWFLVSLVLNKQASKYVTHHHPDRAQKLDRMLTLAEEAVVLCRSLSEAATLATLGERLPKLSATFSRG